MNIYALQGHEVKCSTLKGGYDPDQELAQKHLTIGDVYTVEETEVHSWNTKVTLQEFPGVKFNSVFFEDVIEQSPDRDKEHRDYKKYHG